MKIFLKSQEKENFKHFPNLVKFTKKKNNLCKTVMEWEKEQSFWFKLLFLIKNAKIYF